MDMRSGLVLQIVYVIFQSPFNAWNLENTPFEDSHSDKSGDNSQQYVNYIMVSCIDGCAPDAHTNNSKDSYNSLALFAGPGVTGGN